MTVAEVLWTVDDGKLTEPIFVPKNPPKVALELELVVEWGTIVVDDDDDDDAVVEDE